MNPNFQPVHGAGARGMASAAAARGTPSGVSGASSPGAPDPEALAERVRESFEHNPDGFSASLVAKLTGEQRSALLSALTAQTLGHGRIDTGAKTADALADEFFVQADTQAPFGHLDATEFKAALDAQREYYNKEKNKLTMPTRAQLKMVALSASIPFIGFGFLDNFIMIVAGDQIDAKIAVFGLSTMAAAGLGNLISDIFGVTVADTLEQQAKKFKWSKPPELSKAQWELKSVLYARMCGNVLGISFGCLLGMFPLLFISH